MIYDKETNFVYLSDRLQEWYPDTFNRLTKKLNVMGIKWGLLSHTRDIWVRDYMPLQLSENDFLLYQYQPDYLAKENYREYISNPKQICDELDITYSETSLIIDGGNISACGEFLVITDKVFTENGKEKYDSDFIRLLQKKLNHKIIFIPWHKISEEEPFGHSDGFIHWCNGNKVLMTDHFKTDCKEAETIKHLLEEKGFEITVMRFDIEKPNDDLNWAYVNYLQVGNNILMPAFGIEEDKQAFRYIKDANPDCKVEPFRMKDLVYEGGGALHCMTWNIKK